LSAAQKLVKPSNTAFLDVLKGHDDAASTVVRFAIRTDATSDNGTFEKTSRVFGTKPFRNVCKMTSADIMAAVQSQDRSRRRLIELVVVPSTSPAAAEGRGFQKEMIWFRSAFRIEGAPKHYVCACCGATGDHVLGECKQRTEAWRQIKRKGNAKMREAWSKWESRGKIGPEPSFDGYCWAI
jgi:hypothetical protein